MDWKTHCGLLMKLKIDGMKLSTYMGRRWFLSKGMLVVVALVLLFQAGQTFRMGGFVVTGYSLGVIAANVRSYVVAKKKWELQRELIDWDKVEEIAKNS
jgi:hypothetical protein